MDLDTEPVLSDAEQRIKTLARSSPRDAHVLMTRYYRPRLVRYALRIVKRGEDAEEIAADTLVQALSEPRIFDTNFHIRAWLYRVARNLSFNALRGRKRQMAMLVRHGSWAPNAEPTSADAVIASAELSSSVNCLLLLLTPDHQEILHLRHYEGLEYLEIAARLNVPIGTMQSRLTRAHNRLREYVQSDDLREELGLFR